MGSCASMPKRRIVLLGRKGYGKSSAGNTILGEKVFTPRASDNSVKAQCARREKRRYGRKITVIETPGFFDTDNDDKEMKSEIIKALVECAPEVDAFVIVLKVGEYTSQEMKVLQRHLNKINKDVFDHTVILFTFGKQLKGKTIKEFLKANSQLQELVDKCGGRCHVIDNKSWKKRKWGNKSNSAQVKNLLETIDKMRNKNGCFTNELFRKIEEQIQEQIGKMDGENLPQDEKRKKAKKNVQNKMLEQAAKATAETLTGALLGAGVSLIMTYLQTIFPIRALLNVAAAVGRPREAEAGESAAAETGEKAIAAAVKAAGEAGAGVAAGVLGFAGEMCDAMNNVRAVAGNIQQFVANVFNNNTTQPEENKR
ncbi:GTPase IMAP family member 7-like [Labeo rohita]|uniref:GTPase IMAP family member 7-like n=1 Tax=Labeo rohita TaxID=84645 RepID=UPI0021E32271|nr:GTPase IMAP family member 7-like [Labeo rohita]